MATGKDLRKLKQHSGLDSTSICDLNLRKNFEELNNIHFQLHVLARNTIHYYAGYVAFKLLKEHKCIVCENALTIDKPNTITQDYQLFTAMKGYSNSDIFSNLKVCTDPYFKLVSYLEEKFPSLFQKYKVQPRVGESIFCYFVYELGVGKFLSLCCQEALYGLLRFYIMCKIYFTLRFKNRQFAKKKNASNINFEM